MAHEISFDRNAIGDAFFVGQSAWHSHGTTLVEAPSLEEALRLGGLDFEVKTHPIFQAVGSDDYLEIPGHFCTKREDNGRVLGVVGKRYNVLQNADAFGVLAPMLDNGMATLETGGTLRDGADVWMLVRFNLTGKAAEFFASEGVIPFGLVTNNHTGRRQVQIMFTPIRVVCANTLGMATASAYRTMVKGRTDRIVDTDGKLQAVRVSHTLSVRSRTVEAAKQLFTQIETGMGVVAQQYELLKAAKLDEELFEKLVLKVAAPMPSFKEGEELTKRRQTAVAKVEARRAELTRLWTAGKGHDGEPTAWAAYNGVVESVDHDVAKVWETRGDDRLQSLFDGGLAETKQAVLDSLVRYSMAVAA